LDNNGILEFKICSKDLKNLEENDPKIINKHKNKNHTEKWLNFWSEINQNKHYPTRLNPEIKILYRDAIPEK
jgi:hypothetical protein